MPKNGIVHARLDANLKENVENILAQIGLTSSDAVSLFYKQIELNGGLPFELKIPRKSIEDEIYAEVMKSIAQVENGARPIPIDEAFAQLEAKYVNK